MYEMTKAEILELKIELKEQHLLLILLDLEGKRERLDILKSRDGNDKGRKINGKPTT